MANKFTSGNLKNISYESIIKKGGADLDRIRNSRHVAYRKFNQYYDDRQNAINIFTENNRKKLASNKIKKLFSKFRKVGNFDDGETKQEIYMNRNIRDLDELKDPSEIIANIDNVYLHNGQLIQRTYTLTPYSINDENINDLSENVFSLISNFNNENVIDYDRIAVNLRFTVGNEFSSININKDFDLMQLERHIRDKFNEFSNLYEEKNIELHSMRFFILKQNRTGGCNHGKKELSHTVKIRNIYNRYFAKPDINNMSNSFEKYTIKNYKSINNNCGLVCLIKATGNKANVIKPDSLRKKYNLDEDVLLSCEQLAIIADEEFNHNLIVLNNVGDELFTSYKLYEKTIFLILIDSHYQHLIIDNIQKFSRCSGCNQFFLNSHKCNNGVAEYYHSQVKKDVKYLIQKDNRILKETKNKETKEKEIIYKQELNYDDDILYFDFETFQETVNFKVYAVGYILDGEYGYFYGPESLKSFVELFMKNPNKILCAYNGSRFDFILLLKELLNNHNVEIGGLIENAGRIMQYVTNESKMFDLCNFTMSSLKAACDDYKIAGDKRKSEFDHNKIKSWRDVELYRNEVVPYLELDLISMKELFYVFNSEMFKIQGINITDYLTISSLSYACWIRYIHDMNEKTKKADKINIEIPDKLKYDFIKNSVFGGRCNAIKKEYGTSAEFKDYNDLIDSKDFIFNADVSSLYPTAMAGFEHLDVDYPVGVSRWSDEPKSEFENNKYGFYEINYEPPKNINYPVLPCRLENGGIQWNLLPGKGVYTNVDIQDAISAGYKINFINKCLVYDQTIKNLFSDYILFWYNIKAEEDKKPESERNNSRRNIAKLIMNGLYGKMLQKAHFKQTLIANNMAEIFKFMDDYNFTDWHILTETKILLIGEAKEEIENEVITKPAQYGAFVLSYSRRVMLFYNRLLTPDLKDFKVSYTDTDSLHIHAEDYFKLKESGFIRNGELGFLSNDIKKDGMIFYEKNLGAKNYLYKCIDNQNNIKTVMKTKGIPKSQLREEFYAVEHGSVKFNTMKKIKFKVTSNEHKRGLEYLNIYHSEITRRFNKNQWAGRLLNGNIYYPIGYDPDQCQS